MAGRRSGKTLYVTKEEIVCRELLKENKVIWIVAPNYDLTGRAWDILYGLAINELSPIIENINNSKGSFKITTCFNTIIEAKSADDPKTLVGKGIDLLVVDEAGIMKEKAWKESLMPALIDRKGRAIFIGTPKGKNWFYTLYQKGLDKGQDVYQSWQFSSYANDTIAKNEIDSIALQMDETERRQEIMAEFLEGSGQVFRNIRNCIKGQFEKYKEGGNYVAGLDLAKHQDFTVLKIADINKRQIIFTDRFNQLDWGFQKARIKTDLDRFGNPPCYTDSSGVGDSIYDDLANMDLNVESYKFTNESKNELIKNLSIMLENEEIFIPAQDTNCLNELEVYGYEILPSGKFRYGAPEGLHDDDTTALMLTAWGIKQNKEAQIIFIE